MPNTRILITGMSGLIGGIMRRALEGRYELVALNRRDVPGVCCHRADIVDLEAIRPAFEGVDVVLHLSALAQADAGLEGIVHHNVVGTYNVFEASREAGVKRVVFASSGATVSNYELDSPYSKLVAGPDQSLPDPWPMVTHLSPPRPQGLYGCSKIWGEAVGRMYSDEHKLSVICVRIGAVLENDRPNQPRQYSVWCSHRDIAQMLEECITAPDEPRFDIFYAISNNCRAYRDWTHARDVLGYGPQDSADVFSNS